MDDTERLRLMLVYGPYCPPRLQVGARTICLFKDCDVIVTGWTDAPISWPRCRPVDVPRSHPSLLVDDELARAIRQEPAAAVMRWWGVSMGVVHRWRKALGVTRTNNPGTRRLMLAACQKGADKVRGRPLSIEQLEQRERTALELNLGQYLRTGYHGPLWTAEDTALLGTMTDDEVAERIGKSVGAVRQKRERMGLPNPATQCVGPHSRWTAKEDDLVRTLLPAEVARRTGRTLSAVYQRRRVLWVSRW